MIDVAAVATVLSVSAIGVVIPGPSFVAVVHKAVSGPRSEALAFVSGIVLVNLLWATCAIFGIGIVFSIFPWLAKTVKIAGAAYLIWFGLKLIMSAGTESARAARVPSRSGLRSACLQGIVTNIVNPKSIAFFAAVFSSAAPSHVSVETFLAMLGAVGLTALSWYGLVALVLSHAAIARVYRSAKSVVDY
ncbi:LysE family translocator [Pseudomonas caricapapayae]|uniref:LysE family translocator n=1 Tax=Pseudomonas caricapapayae TaxID=46678 RepID=UPI001CC1D184|nr:LysE family translocator [Pseudomonas caricapapayae]